MLDIKDNQMIVIGEYFELKEEDMVLFSNFLIGINDGEFRKEILSILMFGVNMDLSELRKVPTPREEGNVTTAFCFRNTILEDIHANNNTDKLDNKMMKNLMIESSSKITNWLKMRDSLKNNATDVYNLLVNIYQMMYTSNWNKN